ncbi:protein DELAY OF GERMINATION 1-like [Henckelia pumila]|uniref:protein DELAY OF GERMINATION 1-like n=1 Tax=Henckelia pumila TaxID=405737 RepID=UPI003C6DBEA7
MAQVRPRNGNGRISFPNFFEQWLAEQNQHLESLVSASKENEQQLESGRAVTQQELDGRILSPLIERVIQHYEQYYGTKSNGAKEDILSMFNPSWRSSLEDAFLWIGGWRPSMAFHLLYSKSGLQVEAKLMELIQGLTTGDLGDLSADQLEKVNELQKETVRAEKELTEKLAKKQESVADSSMVELSHVATELIRGGEEAVEDGRVDAALDPKKQALVEILQKADDLRLKTLKKVLQILTPIQSVHFLIAAAELHLRFHEWGKKRDERNREVAEVGVEPRNS